MKKSFFLEQELSPFFLKNFQRIVFLGLLFSSFFTFLSFALAQEQQEQQEKQEQKEEGVLQFSEIQYHPFTLHKGWNLVAFSVIDYLLKYPEITTLWKKSSVNNIYLFDNRSKAFVYWSAKPQKTNGKPVFSLSEFIQALTPLYGEKALSFLYNAQGIWIYTPRTIILNRYGHRAFKEEIKELFARYPFMLYKGWNLIALNALFIDKSWEDAFPGCKFFHIYTFDSLANRWKEINPKKVIQYKDLPKGFFVKVASDCKAVLP